MSYGSYPYEDHLYGIDEQEDRWESRYADYLDQQMEAQYNYEMAERYREELARIEEGRLDTDYVERYMAEMYTEGEHLEPQDSVHQHSVHKHNPHHHYAPKPSDSAHELLHLPMGENDAQAATVGEYLGLLLSTLWLQADGFSGKRPFGNSDWQYPVYIAMIKAGMATGDVYIEFDSEYLDISSDGTIAADEVILQAIRLAYNHEGNK